MASEAEIHSERDQNQDEFIDENEFEVLGYVDEEFEDWDPDGDTYVDEDEFCDGACAWFDDEADGHGDGDDAGEEGFWDA